MTPMSNDLIAQLLDSGFQLCDPLILASKQGLCFHSAGGCCVVHLLRLFIDHVDSLLNSIVEPVDSLPDFFSRHLQLLVSAPRVVKHPQVAHPQAFLVCQSSAVGIAHGQTLASESLEPKRLRQGFRGLGV